MEASATANGTKQAFSVEIPAIVLVVLSELGSFDFAWRFASEASDCAQDDSVEEDCWRGRRLSFLTADFLVWICFGRNFKSGAIVHPPPRLASKFAVRLGCELRVSSKAPPIAGRI